MPSSQPKSQPDKQTLRLEYGRKRSLFVTEHEKDLPSVQAKLNENIDRVLQEVPKGVILSYQALRAEPDPLIVSQKHSQHTWAFPKINGDHMEFYKVDSPDQFEKGQLGILEPIADEKRGGLHKVHLNQVKAVLIPAVAFDLNGQRLGRGKGHYDRFLPLVPKALRIGVAFNCQLSFQPLPVEAHDQRMHFIVTEELIWCPHWESWTFSSEAQQQDMKG